MSGQEFGDCGVTWSRRTFIVPGHRSLYPELLECPKSPPLPPQSHLFLTSLRLSFKLENQEDNYSDKHLKIDLKCLFFLSGDGGLSLSYDQLFATP